jgi:hypothetical protein
MSPSFLVLSTALLGSACASADTTTRATAASAHDASVPVLHEFPPTGTYEVLGSCSFTVGEPVTTGMPKSAEAMWEDFDGALAGVTAGMFDGRATSIVVATKPDSVREYTAIRARR